MSTDDALRAETIRWLSRIEPRLPGLKDMGSRGFLVNVKAYVRDSRHFLGKGDLIRAFEAVIWAWAWLEIGIDMGTLVDSGSR